MPNAWITHVKEFADEKKMKYTDALKSQECKDAYKSKKPKKETNDVTLKIPRKKKAGSPMEMKMPHIEMMMPPMKTKKGKKGMMEKSFLFVFLS